MARFYGQPCPLCGVTMTDDDRLFATFKFFPDIDLWIYSDAVMHWDCYAVWEHRPRFARQYFESRQEYSAYNPYWGVPHSDDQVLVTVNPSKLVHEADVMLAETGSSLRISLRDWEDWLDGEWFESCHHEVEREALAAVLPLLRSKFPTVKSLVAEARKKPHARPEPTSGGEKVDRILHEVACQELAKRAATKGIACPGCGRFSNDYDYARVEEVSESGPQSHLVCRECGEEFGPEDI
jgi:hypothetical protein